MFTSLNKIGGRPPSPGQIKQECRNCKFSDAIKDEPGIIEEYRDSHSKCRFNPPVFDKMYVDIWPVVSKDAWCGKWESNQKEGTS